MQTAGRFLRLLEHGLKCRRFALLSLVEMSDGSIHVPFFNPFSIGIVGHVP